MAITRFLARWPFAVTGLATLVAVAGPAPARAAESGTAAFAPLPALTREEERRLALDALLAAWKESEGQNYHYRKLILTVLARLDPARAEALAGGLPKEPQQSARQAVAAGLLATAPERGLRWLDGFEPPTYFLYQTARTLLPTDRKTAAALLNRAVAAARKEGAVKWRLGTFANLAALAADLGDPRAPALAKEVLAILPDEIKDQDAEVQRQAAQPVPAGMGRASRAVVFGELARRVAWVSPKAAVKLADLFAAEPDRRQVKRMAADGCAARDPGRARVLIEEVRPPPTADDLEGQNWSITAQKVAAGLAPRDPTAAESLARTIPNAYYRAFALAAVARSAAAGRSEALWADALAAAAQTQDHGSHGGALVTTAAVARQMPPGALRRHACALALELAGKPLPNRTPRASGVPVGEMAYTAAVLAPMEPQAARALLDDAIQGCQTGSGFTFRDTSYAPLDVALAMATVDPVRALEMAGALPQTEREGRCAALRRIAELLLYPPVERADHLRFARYDPYNEVEP